MSTTLFDSVSQAVSAWRPHDPAETRTRTEFLDQLVAGPAVLWRALSPVHVTVSAFVLDPSGRSVLLCFHGKGRFWVQPGGHLEPEDSTVITAALRELREETGITPGEVSDPLVADLDHHALSEAFAPCRSHLDLGVAVTASPDQDLQVSDESEDLRWFPFADLPPDAAPGLRGRLATVRRHAASRTR